MVVRALVCHDVILTDLNNKNESQDILFSRELLASIAQANENLTRNVLKTILTANKVKEQICMHEV